MWEFIKSAPWTFAIFGVVLLAAIVLVVVGVVTRGRWTDRGFMRTADEKHALRWAVNRFPLTAWFDAELTDEWRYAFTLLRGELKKVTGRDVFDIGTTIPEAMGFDVEMLGQGQVAFVVGESASTELKWDTRTGAIRSAVVRLPKLDGLSLKVWPIMLHEGCHVLGLDHDEHVSSVMHPQIQNRPQSLTDHDAALLKRTYG